MYKAISKTIDLGDGRTINIETGKLAKQADGSVVVKMGDTMLLATVVSAVEAAENVDFMLTSQAARDAEVEHISHRVWHNLQGSKILQWLARVADAVFLDNEVVLRHAITS